MGSFFFFLLAFATIGTLLWAGLQLNKDQEDPLAERLEALQNTTMVTGVGKPKRRKGSGIMGVIALLPGAEDWIK